MQSVHISGQQSTFPPLFNGVTYGSVLCLVLFYLYIRDTACICFNGHFLIFAHDGGRRFAAPDETSLLLKCKATFDTLFHWSCSKQVKVISTKTKAILFRLKTENMS